MSETIDVEMEVAVRKYKVDKERLAKVLKEHKGTRTNKEIAQILGKPVTLVEHWFRTDNSFAIPEPDIWFELKKLLGITTTEFDESITQFEFKESNFDLRNRIYTSDISPTLTCGCGNHLHLINENEGQTSGENQQALSQPVMPVKQYPFCKSSRPRFKGDSETYIDCKVANTLNTFDLGDKRANEVIVEIVPDCCNQGNYENFIGITECNKSLNEKEKLDLNTTNEPTKAYLASGKDVFGTLQANAGTKRWLGNQEAQSGDYHIIEEKPQLYRQSSYDNFVHGIGATLRASGGSYGGGSESLVVENKSNYIVRRLTPVECARLQGFVDSWGVPDYKESLTDEEYEFWLEVRNTYASVNGKREKEYTKSQMLTWYNKRHSDSAEYKMWGNGVALPPTLYVMQGIYDVLRDERE